MDKYLEFYKIIHENFRYKLNVLKVAHELNNSNLAILLGLKSGTSILNMEGGSLKPSVDVLLRLVSLFGVNIDWLYGRSEEIYCESDIEVLENLMFDLVLAERKIEFRDFDDLTIKYCNDVEYRKTEFSLAERANIIFLLQYLKVVLERNCPMIMDDEDCSSFWSNVVINNRFAGRTKRMRFADVVSERNYIMSSIYFVLNNEYRRVYNDVNVSCDYRRKAKELIEPLYDVEKYLIKGIVVR